MGDDEDADDGWGIEDEKMDEVNQDQDQAMKEEAVFKYYSKENIHWSFLQQLLNCGSLQMRLN